MRAGCEVFVVIAFCVRETVAWNRWSEEQQLMPKAKYPVIPRNKTQNSQVRFYWEASPLGSTDEKTNFALSSYNNVLNVGNNRTNGRAKNSAKNKKKNKNSRNKAKNQNLLLNETSVEKSAKSHRNPQTNKKSRNRTKNRKRHKGKERGQKKSNKKNRRRNKESDKSILEIPLKAKIITDFSSRDIKTDVSIQRLISKLNSNPELAYQNFLGKEAKITRRNLTSSRINVSSSSPSNPNDGGNYFHYRNDTRPLLAPVDKITPQPYSSYDNVVVNATTEHMVENVSKESPEKMSNKKKTWAENEWKDYNEHSKGYFTPKINYSELLKIQDASLNSNEIKVTTNYNHVDPKANETITLLEKLLNSSALAQRFRKGKCKSNNGGCAHFCNDFSSELCSCLDGFQLGSDRKSCFDIDECSDNNGGCEGLCYNLQGSYYCGCPAGLRIGDNLKTCEDINECLLRNGHGPCQGTCTNTFGSYYCGCFDLNGTRLAEDKHTCEDVNECREGQSGCSHGCINTLGRAFCTCPSGMELEADWKTCYDINECEDEEIDKACKYGCVNTVGSYHCQELRSEQNDQIPVAPEHIVCPPLFPPEHGFFHCSRKKAALGLRTRDGRLRITNRPGTFCELVCPEGFKTIGSFRVTCNVDGYWVGNRAGKCSLILGRNYDIRYNYIEVTWAFSKPKIKCPGPISVGLEPGQEAAHITFPPPKTSVNWKYVQSSPASAKSLEAYLPQGHHWITFKATDPYSQLTAKCIIYVVVKKIKTY